MVWFGSRFILLHWSSIRCFQANVFVGLHWKLEKHFCVKPCTETRMSVPPTLANQPCACCQPLQNVFHNDINQVASKSQFWKFCHLCVFNHADQNECATSPCDANAVCTNVPGSYRCECLPGYRGNGVVCTAIQCPRIDQPVNGIATVTGYNVGSMAFYSCDEGYRLRGENILDCLVSGEWSTTPPTCQGGGNKEDHLLALPQHQHTSFLWPSKNPKNLRRPWHFADMRQKFGVSEIKVHHYCKPGERKRERERERERDFSSKLLL